MISLLSLLFDVFRRPNATTTNTEAPMSLESLTALKNVV